MRKNPYFWFVGIVGLILDQLTKIWVVTNFEEIGQSWPLIPNVFHFTYVTNTGAAFSFFQGGVGWLKWLSLAVSVVLMVWAWRGEKMNILEQYGYGFILAGALGNGIDRFLFGYVVDFLDFRLINFPVFNLADTFINMGIICLLIFSLPLPRQRKSQVKPTGKEQK